MANLLTVLIVVGAAAVAGRHLQLRWRTGSASEALLMAARFVLPAKPLSWNGLERRIWRRMLASLEPGVDGAIVVPRTIVVSVSMEDLALIGSGRSNMEATLCTELSKRARAKQWRLTGGPSVVIRGDAECFSGAPIARAVFRPVEPERSSDSRHEWQVAESPTDPMPPVGEQPRETDRPPTQPSCSDSGADTLPMFAFELRGSSGVLRRLDHRTPLVTMGRSQANTITLDAPMVSSHHAGLSFRSGAWWLLDKGSRNGTFLNGRRLTVGESRPVQDSDEIKLAATGPVLTVTRVPAAGRARTA